MHSHYKASMEDLKMKYDYLPGMFKARAIDEFL
jgi:hypothetical protein